MPYVFFVAICLAWGASFILMKKAALAFSPAAVGAWRVAGGAAVLVLIWRLQKRPWPFRREHVGGMLLIAIIGYAWPFAIQPYLVNRNGSGFIGMTVSLVPIMTIGVAMLAGRHPPRRQLIGVVGALMFMGVLMADGLNRNVTWIDLGLALTVPLGYAISNTYVHRNMTGLPAISLTATALSMAAMVLVPLGLSQQSPPGYDEYFWPALAAALALGTVGTGAANWMFNRLVQDHGPLFAGMVTYLIPLGALLWGWADGEPLTTLQIVSLAGILAMVALVQYRAVTPVSETVDLTN